MTIEQLNILAKPYIGDMGFTGFRPINSDGYIGLLYDSKNCTADTITGVDVVISGREIHLNLENDLLPQLMQSRFAKAISILEK